MDHITRAMMAHTESERDLWLGLHECRHAASSAMFCQHSGRVLDERYTVIVEVVGLGQTRRAVLHGSAWDQLARPFLAAAANEPLIAVTVTDAREIHKALRAAQLVS